MLFGGRRFSPHQFCDTSPPDPPPPQQTPASSHCLVSTIRPVMSQFKAADLDPLPPPPPTSWVWVKWISCISLLLHRLLREAARTGQSARPACPQTGYGQLIRHREGGYSGWGEDGGVIEAGRVERLGFTLYGSTDSYAKNFFFFIQ